MHQEDLRIMLVHLHNIDTKIIRMKNEDRRLWHYVYDLLRHRQIFLTGRTSHARQQVWLEAAIQLMICPVSLLALFAAYLCTQIGHQPHHFGR